MNRPAYSICICPDSRLLRTRLEALLSAHPPENGEWQRFTFWGDDGISQSFWEHLTLQGLFATPKALIFRHVQTLPAESLKSVSAAMLALGGGAGKAPASPLTWPLICFEVAVEKGKPKLPAHIVQLPCYSEAEKRGWLDILPGLSPASLPAFIRHEAEEQGLRLRPEEVSTLARGLPPDAALISTELAKLALTMDGKGRLADSAAVLAAQAQDITIFELMRIVQQQNDAPKAWKQILEDRLSGENMVFAFTAILLREARILWQSLTGSAPSLPPQIAMQKKMAAERLGLPGVARLWDLALATDKGIKTGERSPDQAFESLMANLFLLFSGTSPR